MEPRIWLSAPHMGGGEQKFVDEAFASNWIAPLGSNVDNFEGELARYCNTGYAAALNSGTAAIHLALILLGVGRGDYVICQNFTFAATVNPIIYLGAIPVLIDSEPGTWNMDPELLEAAVKKLRQKNGNAGIKAIIAVDLYGMPARWNEILDIGKRYGIPVVEDAAEALGSIYNGEMCGSLGQLGILSFNGNKIITTSCGGALLSSNRAMIDKAKFLASQARDLAPHYQHSEIGYNYRMSNVLAGIGRGQMEVLNKRVKQRRLLHRLYRNLLEGVPGIAFQEEPESKFFSNRWITSIIINPARTGFTSENLQIALERSNIESRPLWKPMHMQPVFSSYPKYTNGVSEKLFASGLCLPSGSNMNDEEISRVITVLKAMVEKGAFKAKPPIIMNQPDAVIRY